MSIYDLKIPRNQTALMQLAQTYAQSAHYFWATGSVEREKLERFALKLDALYHISRDAPARAYAKRKREASVHLLILPEEHSVPWLLLSTPGKDGLETVPLDGRVRDTRLRGQHTSWRHYELLFAPKTFNDEAGKKTTQSTWTWRIRPDRYREYEAYLVHLARQNDQKGMQAAIDALAEMPLFAGVRAQVIRLYREAGRVWGKFNREKEAAIALPELPYMTRIVCYEEQATLGVEARRMVILVNSARYVDDSNP